MLYFYILLNQDRTCPVTDNALQSVEQVDLKVQVHEKNIFCWSNSTGQPAFVEGNADSVSGGIVT